MRGAPSCYSGSPIIGLYSLRQREADAAALAVCSYGPDWNIDQHQSYDGDLALLITPGGPRLATLTFVLHRTADGIQLAVATEESLHAIGLFKTVPDALRQLRRCASSLVWVQEHAA